MAKVDSVKVRMYRHGFGDCFLLRFYSGKTVVFKMLIDCGLKLNDKVDGASIDDVISDIRKEVSITKAGKKVPHLDVLVATHEHWDHVSGFKAGQDKFKGFDIDKIWLAWTEDPDDDEALAINEHLRKSAAALEAATKKLKKVTADKKKNGFYAAMNNGDTMLGMQEKFNAGLEDLLSFYGGALGVAKKSPGGISYKTDYKVSMATQQAFDYIKSLAKGKSGIKYWYPGEIFDDQKALPGVRMYIMGPPRNKMLNKENPSAGAKKEVYLGINNSQMNGFINGVLAADGKLPTTDDPGNPFPQQVTAYSLTAANKQLKNEKNVKPGDDLAFYRAKYTDTDNEWRNVDNEWLGMAGALALQMDSDTNNTSLVLGIELMENEKVLLFPGDAQVGNWLSWQNYEWEVKNNGKKEKVNATKLLNNTVLYKVGHHASHNATLKALGLELMIHEELVAMVPEKNDSYSGIPYSPLMKRLKKMTRGRLMVSADVNYPLDKTFAAKPDGLSNAQWNEFKKNIHPAPVKNAFKTNKLFIEYTVKA